MFNDSMEFLCHVEVPGNLRQINGADWETEMGSLTEWQAMLADSPALLLDAIPGYPVSPGAYSKDPEKMGPSIRVAGATQEANEKCPLDFAGF